MAKPIIKKITLDDQQELLKVKQKLKLPVTNVKPIRGTKLVRVFINSGEIAKLPYLDHHEERSYGDPISEVKWGPIWQQYKATLLELVKEIIMNASSLTTGKDYNLYVFDESGLSLGEVRCEYVNEHWSVTKAH